MSAHAGPGRSKLLHGGERRKYCSFEICVWLVSSKSIRNIAIMPGAHEPTCLSTILFSGRWRVFFVRSLFVYIQIKKIYIYVYIYIYMYTYVSVCACVGMCARVCFCFLVGFVCLCVCNKHVMLAVTPQHAPQHALPTISCHAQRSWTFS